MNKILLIILDGWGYNENSEGNAIKLAQTPHLDRFFKDYPLALLDAAGEAVGLPVGQMGNSEVGHLNLGAGRIVYQELTRIGKCIESGEFFQNAVLLEAMEKVKEKGSALHLIGLVSDGGVHSHLEHLLALLEMARRHQVETVFIHAILDGRDTVPFGAEPFLKRLEDYARDHPNYRIATICGRYFAMDRDRRWDRTEKAYRAYTAGEGLQAPDPLQALREAYDRGEGDEFVQPTVIVGAEDDGAEKDQVEAGGEPLALMRSEDSVIFFNFRPDRVRQITRALAEEEFEPFDRGANPPRPHLATMTEYDRELPLPVAFTLDDLEATLGEVYAREGLAQMRIAETEKYGHVTFFFNGGREKPFSGEDRILVPSPRVATYDLQPEMSAPEVADKIIETIRSGRHPLIVSNFANMDMVGHTGDLQAAVKAVEAVDTALGRIVEEALPAGWHLLIVGDHGNAEEMLNREGETLTAHSANPVPLLLLGPGKQAFQERGILADVAPTILALAGISVPPEMTGENMLVADQLTARRDCSGRTDSED